MRKQKRVGLNLSLEPCSGLYPFCNAEEMLADMFAWALLLPFHLFQEMSTKYESVVSHRPLDYADWISYISEKAMIPEYHATLAHQELKKIGIHLKYEKAKRILHKKLEALNIVNPKEQKACFELYAIVMENLEAWGFSQSQIATILFSEIDSLQQEKSDIEISSRDIIDFIHDFYIRNAIEESTSYGEYPANLVNDIVIKLKNMLVISETGISQIMGASGNNTNQKILVIK